ncbi:MAG: single-stranded-DNA-specific exonuclease RecJ [Thermoguttaceae bacterium]
MAKRWRIHPHDPDRIAALGRAAGIPAVVAQLLICRGITDADGARNFLEPKLTSLRDPQLLPGCPEAARRIRDAVAAGKRIVVYGDYDVDGVTGTAILWLCLKMLGAEATYYVPHRIEEGYGLHADAIRAWGDGKADLLVTVDCGIACVEEAALARKLGLELIITDHHQFGPVLPEAAAIVHPRLPHSAYPFGELSGSGVAFKLAWALCQQASGAQKVGPRMRDFLLQAVGLAALGTVADVVPLVDENRVLVHHGLESLAKCPTLGVATLMRVAGVEAKRHNDGQERLQSEDISFALAPRLNAAGRLGQPQLAVELLVTDRPERALELAQYIDQLNATRQTLERSIQLAAGKQINDQFDAAEDAAFVLAERGWHAGVIGIVAGRLAEKHHRPVVLIAQDQMGVKPGIGSGRSVPGFNLHAALAQCSELLVSYGGHWMAAGLKIEEDKVAAFRGAFCEAVAAELSQPCGVDLRIDAEAPFSAFTLQAVHQIERLAPFGAHNDRPLLCASGATLVGPPKPIGSGGRHLAMKLSQHGVVLRAVAFGGGEWAEPLAALEHPIDVAFRPVVNTYQGRHNVELHLVDWRMTGE